MRHQQPAYQLSDDERQQQLDEDYYQHCYEEWVREKTFGEQPPQSKPQTVVEAFGRFRRAVRNKQLTRREIKKLANGDIVLTCREAVQLTRRMDFLTMCVHQARGEYRRLKGECDAN